MSLNTVRKYVDSLREKQLITTEPTQVTTKNGRRRNGNLFYTIRPIEEAVRYHFEKQLRKAEEEQARKTHNNTIRQKHVYCRIRNILR